MVENVQNLRYKKNKRIIFDVIICVSTINMFVNMKYKEKLEKTQQTNKNPQKDWSEQNRWNQYDE